MMKVEAVETRPVVVALEAPIGSALGQIREFGCILVAVRAGGLVGESLVFTLNNRRTAVLRTMIDELADVVIGRDAPAISPASGRAPGATSISSATRACPWSASRRSTGRSETCSGRAAASRSTASSAAPATACPPTIPAASG